MKFDSFPVMLLSIFVAVLMALPSSLVAAEPARVAVLYPSTTNSLFSRVFDEIVDGIKLNSELKVVLYTLQGGEDIESIKQQFKQDDIEAVISLGEKNYPTGKALREYYPVIHGGVMIEPNGHSGISLVTDPEQFFLQLKQLAPSVKRVYTVYSESSNGWLIRMAKEAADKYDIELNAFEAESLREGMYKLRQLLYEVKDEQDAVWLLLDKMVPDKAALPVVLAKAWDSHIVIFSNNPSHARRGALFALFPDNVGTGKSLGELVLRQRQKNRGPLVLPSKELKVSVNERTASHLGINFSQRQRMEFDLIYPVQ
ncbi:MAG: hypothetical protein L3J62_08330 [Gammaproteobacteria bacterium]|nr:hypothetical protein [Gammaproteobacteria bacterium]MCF6230780.1 hypothetical protein [Gammaproteobacteria bacterium]